MHKPPYIDLTSNSGYEIELIGLITNEMSVEPNFTHVPNRRIAATLSSDAFDAATLQRAEQGNPAYYYSCPYIQYKNIVATKAERDFTLTNLEDLLGLSVQAFQTARTALGEDFAHAAEQTSEYTETVNQRAQVAMLVYDRVDAIVLDQNILSHYLRESGHTPELTKLTLRTTNYSVAFKDPTLRDQFNQAQIAVWESEAYQELQMKYFGTINQNLTSECSV